MCVVGHRACRGIVPVKLDRHVQASLVCTDRCLYQVAKFQINEATAATAALLVSTVQSAMFVLEQFS